VTAEAVNADSLMAARIRQALKCEGVITNESARTRLLPWRLMLALTW
jgi:hypothetical protein